MCSALGINETSFVKSNTTSSRLGDDSYTSIDSWNGTVGKQSGDVSIWIKRGRCAVGSLTCQCPSQASDILTLEKSNEKYIWQKREYRPIGLLLTKTLSSPLVRGYPAADVVARCTYRPTTTFKTHLDVMSPCVFSAVHLALKTHWAKPWCQSSLDKVLLRFPMF